MIFRVPLYSRRTLGPGPSDIVASRGGKPNPSPLFWETSFPLFWGPSHLLWKGPRVDNFLVIRSALVKTERSSPLVRR